MESVGELREHWWWRPGWRAGRHFYACHLAVAKLPAVRDLARLIQGHLTDFPDLDLIPQDWLHLTMQGVGFTDEVSTAEADAIIEALTERLAGIEPPVVTLRQILVVPEAVYLPAEPARPLVELRRAVRDGVRAVLGADRMPDSGTALDGYRPHVSVAYSAASQPAGPIVAALAAADFAPVELTVDSVDFLEFHRDNRMYEWTSDTPIPLRRG